MAATLSANERVDHINTFEDALPFLEPLPLDIIKL